MTETAAGLLTAADVREICGALDIRPTKTLGQNFVHDPGTVRRIVREAQVREGEHVLEVGPGLGSLTLAILEQGAYVSAVEIDEKLACALPATIRAKQPQNASRLRILRQDALKICGPKDLVKAKPVIQDEATEQRWGAIGSPTALVANLPYNVAVPVLLTLLAELPSIERVLVMVQAEVADRLGAGPGSRTYGVPSLKAAWYGQASRSITIGRTVFWPVPNVDSALVRLNRTDNCPQERHQELKECVFELVDTAFAQRRKTLRQALKKSFGSASNAECALNEAGISPSARGETLTIEDFVKLAQVRVRTENTGDCGPKASGPKGQKNNADADTLTDHATPTAGANCPKGTKKAINAGRSVVASAPGKINLLLRCASVQKNGYHPLLTVFQGVSRREYVRAQERSDGQICIKLEPASPLVPLDEKNLAWKAADAVRQALGCTSAGVDLTIMKNIPVAGGMAGGSADCAATLVACNHLWGGKLEREKLVEIGKKLGADIPAVLFGGTSLGRGYGDQITELRPAPVRHLVLAELYEGLSTQKVFSAHDLADRGRPSLTADLEEEFVVALANPDPGPLSELIENDLQVTAIELHEGIAPAIAGAKKLGALAAFVSGSGPTVAALVKDSREAQKLADCWGQHARIKAVHVVETSSQGAHVEADESVFKSGRDS